MAPDVVGNKRFQKIWRFSQLGRYLHKTYAKYLGRVINYFAGINLSIRSKMLLAFIVVILLMGLVNAVMIAQVLRYNREYDAIITNILAANSLSGYLNPAIDSEMWDIVAGKKDFADGRQYEILTAAKDHTYSMTWP